MDKLHRVEGQIWVDKKTPNRLKYHVNSTDYTVDVSPTYSVEGEPADNQTEFHPAGTLVKMGASGFIEPVTFPDDLENVIGVLASDIEVVTAPNPTNPSEPIRKWSEVSVIRSGYLIIKPRSENESAFYTGDLECESEKPKHFRKGSPVYWFIGRYDQNDTFISPENYKGCLTFATPVGYNRDTTNNPEYNVGYNNLPQIGNVVDYVVESSKIIELRIHLNFSRFDSSLEWTWPRKHVDGDFSSISYGFNSPNIKESEQQDSTLTIKHGLLQKTFKDAKPKCICEVLASREHEKEDEFRVAASISQDVENNKTSITVSTPDTMYYRVMGTVSYAFDEEN